MEDDFWSPKRTRGKDLPRVEAPPRKPPRSRRLKVYSFDPSLNTRLETAFINRLTLQLPWEDVKPGPAGEYFEVVDVDRASGCRYAPVNLDDPYLLAQDGFEPDEGNYQFHQQMVYAVAMVTVENFERALGRPVLWLRDRGAGRHTFLRRLHLYPHGIREANAFYSPQEGALFFGYFPAASKDSGDNLPGGIVFTCLSHDIIAHQITHAVIHSVRPGLLDATNFDVYAVHEGLSDTVSLFQRFAFPEVLRHQIARTRGNLADQNLLGQIAQQFGQAIGGHGALRDALGRVDPETKKWVPRKPDPEELSKTLEPHARGAILQAAIFEAFNAVYSVRSADLLRISTSGTGVLGAGDLHPDLINRLAAEAASTADHILQTCIRALDYCPAVDIDFGDFLRALVTADRDLDPAGQRFCRIALIEAFRRRGIFPRNVQSLSAESLLWPGFDGEAADEIEGLLRAVESSWKSSSWLMSQDRTEIWKNSRVNAEKVLLWLRSAEGRRLADRLGLRLDPKAPLSIERDKPGRPAVSVRTVHLARRPRLDGGYSLDLIVEILQKRRGYYDTGHQAAVDEGKTVEKPEDFLLYGGHVLIIDFEDRRLRYCISKSVDSDERLEGHRQFFKDQFLGPS